MKIKIKEIERNENSRVEIRTKDLEELMDSIKQHGLLQPIGVQKKNGKYEVVFGNRRLEACRKLGHNYIEAIVKDELDNDEFLLVNLVENIQRKDIKITELARIVSDLQTMGFTVGEIASRLSMPKTRIQKALNAYDVPIKYRKKVKFFDKGESKKGNIPACLADRIIQIKRDFGLTIAQVDILFDRALHEELTLPHIREIARMMKAGAEFNSALEIAKKIRVISVKVPIYREDIKRIEKETKRPITLEFLDILYGKSDRVIDKPAIK